MSLLEDLSDYKLEASFQTDPDCVVHTSYKADWARGIQEVAVVEKWAPQEPELGAGTFGTVRLEKRLGGEENARTSCRAVKTLFKSQMSRLKIDYQKELIALTKFSRSKFSQYQLFVEFLGWFEDKNSIYLAMEYFPLGTLNGFMNAELKEHDARTISFQLLKGLTIMHMEGFTHRDIKPENIFVVQKSPSWWVKIGDFGISKRVSNNDTALHTATGTPHYMAPEVFHYVEADDDESDAYTNAVDIWSFACVVYKLMALQVPFPIYPRNLVTFCRGGPFPAAPLNPRTSQEGINFIKKVLVPHPNIRPTAKEALKEGWLYVQPPDENEPLAVEELPSEYIKQQRSRHQATVSPSAVIKSPLDLISNSRNPPPPPPPPPLPPATKRYWTKIGSTRDIHKQSSPPPPPPPPSNEPRWRRIRAGWDLQKQSSPPPPPPPPPNEPRWRRIRVGWDLQRQSSPPPPPLPPRPPTKRHWARVKTAQDFQKSSPPPPPPPPSPNDPRWRTIRAGWDLQKQSSPPPPPPLPPNDPRWRAIRAGWDLPTRLAAARITTLS